MQGLLKKALRIWYSKNPSKNFTTNNQIRGSHGAAAEERRKEKLKRKNEKGEIKKEK